MRLSSIAATLGRRLRQLALDERGGEAMEYAIVSGLIILGAIAAIIVVGTRVTNDFTALDAGM